MEKKERNIQSLKKNEIFVFGSNLAGRHGAGAAKLALNKFGAIYGQGSGLQGQSYAIPTKDGNLDVLSLWAIHSYVNDYFTPFTIQNPQFIFLVTKIGCGLAGYTYDQIKPLFRDIENNDNIIML